MPEPVEIGSNDPSLQLLGIKIDNVGSGHSEATMVVKPEMLNAHGICHGGFIFTLADAAFAYACNSYDFDAVAQNCTINFIRPGKTGNVLTANAEEIILKRRTGIYDITVSDENSKVIAYFRGNSYRIG